MKIKHLEFISYLRVLAVISILLCHLVVESSNPYVQMTGQFFNIGVEIFFIISGFCFGLQGEIKDSLKWYNKRLKRIFIPYWIFFIAIALIYMVKGLKINILNYITCLFGVQGAVVGVQGADHTWFITSLLICYIVTPIISAFYCTLSQDKKKLYLIVFIQAIIIPLFLVLIPCRSFYTVGVNIPFYMAAYCIGRDFYNYSMNKKAGMGFLIVMILAFVIRLIGKATIDGTKIYDCIIVIFTQYIAAFCILGLFVTIFRNIKKSKLIDIICGISFEIYLYHYMFIVGPVSLMKITNSYVINCVIVIAITVLVSYTLNKFSIKIGDRIENGIDKIIG